MIGAILDRLALMHADIPTQTIDGKAIKVTVYREAPPVIQKRRLPLCYGVYLGFTETPQAEAAIQRSYRFQVEMLVQHLTASEMGNGGAVKAIRWATLLAEAFDDYYNSHRFLSTDALPDLEIVIAPMAYTNEADDPIISYDGNSYIGTVFTLTIESVVYGD